MGSRIRRWAASVRATIRHQIFLLRCNYDVPEHTRRTLIVPARLGYLAIEHCLEVLGGKCPLEPSSPNYTPPEPLSPHRLALLAEFHTKLRLEFGGYSPEDMFVYLTLCISGGTAQETFETTRTPLFRSLDFWVDDEAVAGEFGRVYRKGDQYLQNATKRDREGIWEDVERWVRGDGRWKVQSGVEWPVIPPEEWRSWKGAGAGGQRRTKKKLQ